MVKIDFKEELINFVHMCIPLTVISLVFLPNKLLKYVWFTPILFYPIWWIFGGCPLTHASKKHKKHGNWALFQMRKFVKKDATESESWYFVGIWICLSIIISGFKLMNQDKKVY